MKLKQTNHNITKRHRFWVHIFDMGSDEQGIVHMVGPETGLYTARQNNRLW